MGDVNLGTISAELDLDTSKMNQRVDEVLDAWDRMNKGASEASTGLSGKMITGVNQYQQKLDIIASKLERQRKLIAQLEATSNKPIIGSNSAAEVEKATAQLENEKIKLKELEAQFDRTYNAQRNFILQQDKTAQKVQETAKKMDLREAGANAQIGANLAATGLRSIDQIAPGVAGNIGNIVTQINYARQAMTSASSAPMKWAMGISTAVGIALTLVVAGIQQMQEAEEERQRIFDESVQKIQDYADKIKSFTDEINTLNNASASTNELVEANRNLANTFPELVVGWDNNGNAILANNQALDDYLETLKKQQEIQRESIVSKGYDLQNEYNSTKESLDSLIEAHQVLNGSQVDFFSNIDKYVLIGNLDKPYAEEVADLESKLIETETKLKSRYKGLVQGEIELTNINGEVIGTYQEMNNAQEAVANNIILSHMQDLINESITYEAVAKEINSVINDQKALQEQYGNLLAQNDASAKQAQLEQILTAQYGQQEATIEDLSNAYTALSEGRKLEEAQLSKLAQTYPEIKEYLQETGDLTLKNGQIIAEAMNGIDYSGQISALNDLSGAYQSLSEGQMLSVSQLYELGQQYPLINEYINQTGDLTLQNGEILKQVYEIQRQNTIETLSANQAQAEAMAQKTSANIRNIEAEIQAMQLLLSLYRDQASIQMTQDNIASKQKDLENQKAILDEHKAAADKAAAAIKALSGKSANIGWSSGSSTKKGSSKSSASTKNEAYQAELKQLEHKRKMDQLTSQQELDWLQRLSKQYKLSADEKMDLEYRIYSVQKKLQEEAEKAAAERLNAEYKANENKKSLGQLSAREELAWLQKIQRTFKMNKEEQMELEIKLYNLKKELHEEEINNLNTIGDAVTEALRQRYEQQKQDEEKRIDESIENWQTWEDETCEAIQGQIDALDELEKQQDSEEKRREYENKRQAAALQLKYEKDDYNRKQIEKQIAQMDAEEQKRLAEEARDAERKRLEEQMEQIKETSSQQQQALEKEKEALAEQYEELLKEFNLQAEAEKTIMESSQKEILSLIQSYAPEYGLAGQTLGEKLVDGFKAKVGDIEAYLEKLTSGLAKYQQQMAAAANQAADRFWASRKEYDEHISSLAPSQKPVSINMEVNFNQPVQSPIEVRRELNRVSEEMARRIGG